MLRTLSRKMAIVVSVVTLGLVSGHMTPQTWADEPTTTTVRISKVGGGRDTFAELKGAQLSLSAASGAPQNWTTIDKPNEVKLTPGSYTLTETTAPDGYDIAQPITFKVLADGKVEAPASVLSYAPADSKPVRAYNDLNDDNFQWGFTSYGKNYYVDRDTDNQSAAGDEVIYCFNMDLKQPPDSMDYGGEIEPDYTTMKPVNFAARYVSEGLAAYASTPKEKDPAKLALKLRKVIEAGYPNNKKGFQEDLTATQFRAATQLAVYYWSDSLTLDKIREIVRKEGVNSQRAHGFGAIDTADAAKVKEAYQKIIDYSENTATDADIVDKNIGVYLPDTSGYQNFISSKHVPQDRIPVITMVDMKTVVPDTPQPGPKVDTSEAKDPKKDCDKKQVSETFTVTTTPYKWDSAAKKWVLDTAKATSKDEVRTRPMTEAEAKSCVVAPMKKGSKLASTGVNTGVSMLVATIAVILGGLAVGGRRRFIS